MRKEKKMPISVKTSLLSLVLIAALAVSTSSQAQFVGDMNADHVVDSKDLQTLVWQWLSPGCITPGCVADLDGVNGVNMADLIHGQKQHYDIGWKRQIIRLD
jgi:hypothetical protein